MMTGKPATYAWAAIAITILMGSCAEGDPPLPPWADDVQVTGHKWDTLPKKIEVEAGYSLDLTLSFKWTRDAGVIEQRAIRPPEEWLVTGTVLTEDGEIAAPTPFSFEREFYDAVTRIGTERLLSDNSLVWVSPDPPKNTQAGRRYLWGHVQMPDKPGTYRVVVKVYPSVQFPDGVNPDRGPCEELYTATVDVGPATKPPPAVMHRAELSTPATRFTIDRERGRLNTEPL